MSSDRSARKTMTSERCTCQTAKVNFQLITGYFSQLSEPPSRPNEWGSRVVVIGQFRGELGSLVGNFRRDNLERFRNPLHLNGVINARWGSSLILKSEKVKSLGIFSLSQLALSSSGSLFYCFSIAFSTRYFHVACNVVLASCFARWTGEVAKKLNWSAV